MAGMIEVAATHWRGEQVVVEFAGSRIVSDHPVRMGGAGKGPSPGELLLAGLLASAVQAVRDAARRTGRSGSVVARGVFRTDLRRAPGPLPAIAWLAQARRRVEVRGPLQEDDRQWIAEELTRDPIAARLRKPAALAESVVLRASSRPRGAVEEAGEGTRALVEAAERIPMGELRTGVAEAQWRMSATSLGDAVLVGLSNQKVLAVEGGPSAAELLLGGLAACTAIFVGRNAMLKRTPIDGVTVVVRAPATLERIEKATEIRGNLASDEFEALKYCADHCALGETLLRGMAIADDVAVLAGRGDVPDPARALAGDSPPPPLEDCDDGSCCLPEMSAGATSRPA